ncbi:hypothetical protein CR194_11675 [Salipaludibacillus keqinensis]|uniref:Uncharacterized protein n=1 Tax=Salipaludibacillus keqinensis TaxID=2045207 RepID=A0A323TGA8_9BACI|nr:YtzH-like family protein [Salipaludibacillus keqinensis]PYZ93799.1 hypothetical protein CR194_11675 [Salipaludibacillus keqinensis]
MSIQQILEQLQSLLKQQKENSGGTKEEFNKIEGIIKVLREENINENFDGTIQEIHSYVDKSKETDSLDEWVQFHKLNLSRWVEELSLLIDGGGKVTIDYEQRKGREV